MPQTAHQADVADRLCTRSLSCSDDRVDAREDLAWLREQWDGPFMIKGITRPDDARRAADVGATAISVSNHGGNNLDSTPATIRWP